MAPSEKPIQQVAQELYELVVAYFKQETTVPLQKLGRYVAFGLLGSLLLSVGVLFVALSILRALQEETGSTFTGNWSWAPYGIVAALLILTAAVVWAAGTKRAKENV